MGLTLCQPSTYHLVPKVGHRSGDASDKRRNIVLETNASAEGATVSTGR